MSLHKKKQQKPTRKRLHEFVGDSVRVRSGATYYGADFGGTVGVIDNVHDFPNQGETWLVLWFAGTGDRVLFHIDQVEPVGGAW